MLQLEFQKAKSNILEEIDTVYESREKEFIKNHNRKPDRIDESIIMSKICSEKMIEHSTDTVNIIREIDQKFYSYPVMLNALLKISRTGLNENITIDLEKSDKFYLDLNAYRKVHSLSIDVSATLHLQDFIEFLRLRYFDHVKKQYEESIPN